MAWLTLMRCDRSAHFTIGEVARSCPRGAEARGTNPSFPG